MQSSDESVWNTHTTRQFADVLAAIADVKDMQNFLCDVMTIKKIIEISSRLEAAKMLRQGKKYTEIIERTKLSSRTVARINGWIQNGSGGYEAALKLVSPHPGHISPASAE